MNKKLLKYVIPSLSLVVILVLGFFLLSTPNTDNSKTASDQPAATSTGCNIKYQPKVKKYVTYPSMCINTAKNYSAKLDTSFGTISIDLFAKNAPKTVNSFVFLAKSGFFDNLTFHRIVSGFVIQGGDPNGDGTGNPGYKFPDEINAQSLGLSNDQIKTNEQSGYSYNNSFTTAKITRGIVAMANGGANSNGSQFFITLADQPSLDGMYTPFGTVTSGMDVADKIASVDVDGNSKPYSPVVIKKVTISEN